MNKILDLLNLFIDSKLSDNRSKKYCVELRGFIIRLSVQCKWVYLSDIKSIDFINWKLKHCEYTIKTKNEYLSALKNFINWSIANKYLVDNPFSYVKKIRSLGAEKRKRRSLTFDELKHFLNCCHSSRKPLYFFVVYTGLRRNEAFSLKWKDIFIDNEDRYIILSADITKNRQKACIVLHHDVKKVLLNYRPINYNSLDFVFKRLYRLVEFREDLKRSNIDYIDDEGRYFDFHALRHTFNTLLCLNGVSLRSAMQLMRHSTESLTSKVYLDCGKISNYSAIDKLPCLLDNVSKKNGSGSWIRRIALFKRLVFFKLLFQ